MLLGTHWCGICRMRMTDESHTMLRCQMTPPTRSPAGWLAGRRRSMCHPRRAHCSLSDDLSHSESHDHQNRLSSLLDLSILQSGKCFALACTDLCFLIQIHLLCAFVLFRRQPQSNQQLLCWEQWSKSHSWTFSIVSWWQFCFSFWWIERVSASFSKHRDAVHDKHGEHGHDAMSFGLRKCNMTQIKRSFANCCRQCCKTDWNFTRNHLSSWSWSSWMGIFRVTWPTRQKHATNTWRWNQKQI